MSHKVYSENPSIEMAMINTKRVLGQSSQKMVRQKFQ